MNDWTILTDGVCSWCFSTNTHTGGCCNCGAPQENPDTIIINSPTIEYNGRKYYI